MDIIIDEGNTSVKIGCFVKKQLVEYFLVKNTKEVLAILALKQYERLIYSSVRQDYKNHPFDKQKTLLLDYNTPLPIVINYDTPITLGVDRIAGACSVYFLKSTKNVLVIDMGSCITFDLLCENTFMGGIISPGMQMRIDTMPLFTGKLPIIKVDKTEEKIELLGKTTESCMKSGVINGIIGEINHTIARFEDEYQVSEIFLTGGDAKFFDKKLKTSTFVSQNLVLEGLYRILEYNV